jgi:hypothetical protein
MGDPNDIEEDDDDDIPFQELIWLSLLPLTLFLSLRLRRRLGVWLKR